MTPLFLLFLIPLVLAEEKTVEYYQKLWEENTKDMLSYVSPTRSVAFENYTKKEERSCGEFDYIVVGAGSAGATLAARLARKSHYTVLLLEAGGEEDDFQMMPGAVVPLQMNKERNWGYRSVPQTKACLGMSGNTCTFPRGRGLGGSSAINAMLWTRNNKVDFDEFEKLGNKGWNYDNLLPYFMKAENATDLDLDDTTDRGLNGPMHLSYPEPLPGYATQIIDGFKDLGYLHGDYNNGNSTGKTAVMQLSTKNGRRHSTNQAYLKNVCGRNKCRNLKVMTNSLVTKVLYKESKTSCNKIATSVKFIHNGRVCKSKARKEIILSAGTINSPQILMLSGIGPADHLMDLGITPHVDLPVGQHFQEQPALFLMEITTNLSLSFELNFTKVLEDYVKGKGEMTYSFVHEVAFQGNDSIGTPLNEYMWYQSNIFHTPEMIFKALQYEPYMQTALSGQPNSLYTIIMLATPKSVGNITLRSKDPLDYPLIEPNMLHDDEDVESLYQGVMDLYKLCETPTFKKFNAKVHQFKFPACEPITDEKEKTKCIIRHKADGIFHPGSSCRMGNSSKTSVVDNKLKVHGFDNLRVVDISVLPRLTSAHYNAVAIMLGEKKADEILNPRLEKRRHG